MILPYVLIASMFIPVLVGAFYLGTMSLRVHCGFSRWFVAGSVMAGSISISIIGMRIMQASESRIFTIESGIWMVLHINVAGYLILTLLAGIMYLRRVQLGGTKRHDDRLD